MGSPDYSWIRAVLPALGTAVCFAISPVFFRRGLEYIPDPTIAVFVGMAVALAYETLTNRRAAISLIDSRSGRFSFRAYETLAGVSIAMATILRYHALALIPVAAVTTAIRINVPIVLLLGPVFLKQKQEALTAKTWIGAALIVAGAVIVRL